MRNARRSRMTVSVAMRTARSPSPSTASNARLASGTRSPGAFHNTPSLTERDSSCSASALRFAHSSASSTTRPLAIRRSYPLSAASESIAENACAFQ